VSELASLDPIEELNLGYLGTLYGCPCVACVAGTEVLQVSAHLWVGEAGNPSLDTVDFHSGNTA